MSALRAGLAVDDAAIGTRVAMRGSPPLERSVAPSPTERTFRRGLRYAEPAAAALARILIPEELVARLPKSGELVVVAPGALALLPFATLPLGGANALTSPFGNPLAIPCYAPSLAAVAESERRATLIVSRQPAALRTALKNALVVGNPRMPSVPSPDGRPVALAPLPGAGAEAAWVATQVGATPLTGAQATETRVRERLASAPLIHLATHGYAYASTDRARQSFVALAPGGATNAAADGLFTVGEMLDGGVPMLRAELVVLSACQTGLGDLKQAEGTVGLQRAFLGRGARSVLRVVVERRGRGDRSADEALLHALARAIPMRRARLKRYAARRTMCGRFPVSITHASGRPSSSSAPVRYRPQVTHWQG